MVRHHLHQTLGEWVVRALAPIADSLLAWDATSRVLRFTNTLAGLTLTSPTVNGITNGTGLSAGVFTPTRSAEVNTDANVTIAECSYARIGNTVIVKGRVTINPTLTATATGFEMTLPVASNLGAVEDLGGIGFCGAIAEMGAAINGVVANDTAKFEFISSDTASQIWSFMYMYEVI